MHFQLSAAAIALATSALASPVPLEKRGAPCTNGAVIFAVRGSDYGHHDLSNDPYYADIGPGMQNVANAVLSHAGNQGSIVPIAYPAIAGDSKQYPDSVSMGITNLQNAIYDYIGRCSNGKVFVIGNSQGAQIVTGALAGSKNAGPLNGHMRITGGVAFADPTYQDGRFPVDAGTGANNGHNGRVPGTGSKYDFLNANFGPRFRSYCQAGDEFCDTGNGPDAGDIHGRSPGTHASAAIAFLTSLF